MSTGFNNRSMEMAKEPLYVNKIIIIIIKGKYLSDFFRTTVKEGKRQLINMKKPLQDFFPPHETKKQSRKGKSKECLKMQAFKED